MNFFDYMNLAKKEHKSLIEAYPELETLSVRELEVFDRLLTDKTLSQIAEELFLSYSSVHFHCKKYLPQAETFQQTAAADCL